MDFSEQNELTSSSASPTTARSIVPEISGDKANVEAKRAGLDANLYLAKKHGGGLWPKTMEDEAQAIQWSFWVMTEVEKPALAVLLHRFFLPEDQRDSKLADEGEQQLQKPLEVLDQRLATTGYLVGPTFTVADLNVASVLSWVRMGGVDLAGFPHVDQWLAGCLKRPAAVKARPAPMAK